jgi:hypothetical protein
MIFEEVRNGLSVHDAVQLLTQHQGQPSEISTCKDSNEDNASWVYLEDLDYIVDP